jgi:NAD(P)-dependent dehydrogenase (short-subunit alcohol dehydrogenase family)
MPTDLSGKTVVLTGAFGRLGRILTRRLLDDGATVAGLDARTADPVVDSDRLHLFKADLTTEAGVEEAFATLADEVGAPDALVHTVGMWDGQPFAETSLEDWEQMLRVNLTSTFLCFRAAVRQMTASGSGGRLVGIASRQGADGGVAEQAAYSASKAGVVRLVEAVAAEYEGAGITAAAVAPSMILFGGEGEGVSAEHIAELCAMLCSDEGAAHNGTVLRAYGDG